MEHDTTRIARFTEVSHISGLARTSIYRLIKDGKFPAPIKIGERAVGWRLDEITSWLESRTRGAA